MAVKRKYQGYGRTVKRFANMAGSAVRIGLRFRNRFGGSQTRTRNSRNRDYGNLTVQNDEHQLYGRKRAPRRVRRAAKRAFKNFTYNLDRTQGMRTCLIPHSESWSNIPTSGSDAQKAFAVTLYGYGENGAVPGTNTNWANGDFAYIATLEAGGAPSSISASNVFRFKSAVMNLTLRNGADTSQPTVYGDGLMFVDVYHVIAKKNAKSDVTNAGSPAEIWDEAINMQTTLPAGTVVNGVNADGCTPFDAPEFGRLWTIKRVRRVRLSAGQIFSTQLRDPGNYVLREGDLRQMDQKGNLTEGYIVVFYNPQTITSSGIRYAAKCDVNYTKNYHYYITEDNEERIGRSNLI